MEFPSNPGEPPTRGSRPLLRRTIGAVVMTASLLLVPGQHVSADPEGSGDLNAKLEQLEKRADRLAEKYRGELVTLNDTERAAERASSRAQSVQGDLNEAREQVARLAARKYMNGGVDPAVRVMMGDDPQSMLNRAATIDYLARQNVRQIGTAKRLTAKARKAQQRAEARVQDVQEQLQDMEQRKEKVQQLIERYEAEAAARAERAASAVSSPGNITARMREVNAEIVGRFGEGYGVHCYRPDDSGEHPDGRACDYMLSSGGATPSGSQVERGHEIAEWARANASRLGIMYVIYRQRIWDARSGGGWESMEDRGGATANHVDHVHVSVF